MSVPVLAQDAAEAPAAEAEVAAETDATTATEADAAVSADAEASADGETAGGAATDAAPAAPSADEQNAAIAAFTEAQKQIAAGQNAQAAAGLKTALPTIRQLYASDSTSENAGFLGSAISLLISAEAAQGNTDALGPLFVEAVPLWRTVYEADTTRTDVRNTLASMLNNAGNTKLQAKELDAAKPYFEEALALTKPVYETNPGDAANANALLSATIGMNNATREPEWFEKVKELGTKMQAAGQLDAGNAQVMKAILGA